MNKLRETVENTLRQLIDPEAGMDVVELGLIEDVRAGDGCLWLTMIPTTPGCPLLDALEQGAIALLQPVFPELRITIDWRLDIPWTPERMGM
jgi:metal-sulfur cluster biosynthetic enzyme